MNKIKAGDKAWLRGTATEDHGVMGFMPTFEREYIPDVPNLPAVARVLAAHGTNLTAAIEMAYVDSTERGDRRELQDALRAFAAALNGGAS